MSKRFLYTLYTLYTIVCFSLLLGGCGSNPAKVTIFRVSDDEFQAVASADSEIDATSRANQAASKRCQALGKVAIITKTKTKKIEPEAIDKVIGKTATVLESINPGRYLMPGVNSKPIFHVNMRFKCH